MTALAAAEPLLVLDGATKSFGAVRALENGSVTLYPGEAHALLGENGAGKSTLVKILAGVHRQDSGELTVAGQLLTFNGPAASKAAGISIIYQEPTLFPDLTVAENIFMGRQPLGAGRRIDRPAMNKAAADVFARLGVVLDPDRLARGLSVADQQIVEIAPVKAVAKLDRVALAVKAAPLHIEQRRSRFDPELIGLHTAGHRCAHALQSADRHCASLFKGCVERLIDKIRIGKEPDRHDRTFERNGEVAQQRFLVQRQG